MASNRQYATIAEVEEMADVTSVDNTEFEDRISQAEELIDAYVGFQEKSLNRILQGKATSATTNTLVDTSSDTPLDYDDNFLTFCVIDIIGGTGAGQRRYINASDKDTKSITVSSNWSTVPDSSSIYKIYQLGKFPRLEKDVFFEQDESKYYKSIPEAVKRATAAQVQFIIEMGDDYFAGDDAEMDSERILNYSYSRGSGGGASQSAVVKMVAPKARVLLRGIKNRTGRLIAD